MDRPFNVHPSQILLISVLVLVKFSLPGSASLSLKDSSGVEVDSDIFDELLKSSGVSFKAEELNGEILWSYTLHFLACCSVVNFVNNILPFQVWVIICDWLVTGLL